MIVDEGMWAVTYCDKLTRFANLHCCSLSVIQAISRAPKVSTLSSDPMTIHSLYIYDRYEFPIRRRNVDA